MKSESDYSVITLNLMTVSTFVYNKATVEVAVQNA